MTAHPRRTCPACARRYAGLVDPDCPVCQGLGVLNLGAAALHNFDPAPVARAVELYIETRAQRVRQELPLGQHRDALEAAVDELRLAGVLSSTADASGRPAHARQPVDSASARVAELDAYRAARTLGTPVSTRVTRSLDAPLIPLEAARPRDGRPPQASATGHRSATATIADPIDPIGPDSGELELALRTATHSARVIAAAVPLAALKRSRHA